MIKRFISKKVDFSTLKYYNIFALVYPYIIGGIYIWIISLNAAILTESEYSQVQIKTERK